MVKKHGRLHLFPTKQDLIFFPRGVHLKITRTFSPFYRPQYTGKSKSNGCATKERAAFG
jgi:hypothetical protein